MRLPVVARLCPQRRDRQQDGHRADRPAGAHSAPLRSARRTLAPGTYELTRDRQVQHRRDAEGLLRRSTCCRRPAAAEAAAKIALFDPKGETGKLLEAAGRRSASPSTPTPTCPAYDVLIVGKAALTADGPAPDVAPRARRPEGDRVRADRRRAGEAVRLPRRGVRPAATSSRACPTIPLLAGLDAENLRDWRGEATILPPRLKYEPQPRFDGRRRSSGATSR